MKKYIINMILLIVLTLTILFSQGFSSEKTSKKKTQELQHEVSVTLKLIQVYVTDSSGNPVTNLNKDDFLIYDNKKLQKITEFERYTLIPPEKKPESQPETKDQEPARPTTPSCIPTSTNSISRQKPFPNLKQIFLGFGILPVFDFLSGITSSILILFTINKIS